MHAVLTLYTRLLCIYYRCNVVEFSGQFGPLLCMIKQILCLLLVDFQSSSETVSQLMLNYCCFEVLSVAIKCLDVSC